jgi:hypothetical protein
MAKRGPINEGEDSTDEEDLSDVEEGGKLLSSIILSLNLC